MDKIRPLREGSNDFRQCALYEDKRRCHACPTERLGAWHQPCFRPVGTVLVWDEKVNYNA